MITSFVVPISIVMALGVIAGVFWHRVLSRHWLASAVAAITTGIVWVIGCEIFLSVTAPSEGFAGMSDLPYSVEAFMVTSAVALFPALLTGLLVRKRHPRLDRRPAD